jgi:Brp/Blh family beta-carotene 15,15'-monooxygenase
MPLLALPAAPLVWAVDPPTLALWAAALAWIGMPHGGADDVVATPLMRPLLGRLWYPAFTVAYLTVALVVLTGVFLFPVVSAALFVAVAAVHFGLEDTNPRWAGDRRARDAVEVVAQGGAPFFLPLLLHPERTGAFLSLLTGSTWAYEAMTALALVWLAAFAAFWLRRIRPWFCRGDVEPLRSAAPVAALTAAFLVLPPLAAFTLFFLAVHVPRHTAGLARRHSPGCPRRGLRFARRAGMWMTVMTVPLIAALMLAMEGTLAERFVRATFWGIWALTVPHVMLDCADRRWGRGRLG